MARSCCLPLRSESTLNTTPAQAAANRRAGQGLEGPGGLTSTLQDHGQRFPECRARRRKKGGRGTMEGVLINDEWKGSGKWGC